MNRPNDRRRNPTHPHTMMVEARRRRHARRWYDRHPEVLASLTCTDEDGLYSADELRAQLALRTPPTPEEMACDFAREAAYWRDTNRWGIDIEAHPDVHAEIQAA